MNINLNLTDRILDYLKSDEKVKRHMEKEKYYLSLKSQKAYLVSQAHTRATLMFIVIMMISVAVLIFFGNNKDVVSVLSIVVSFILGLELLRSMLRIRCYNFPDKSSDISLVVTLHVILYIVEVIGALVSILNFYAMSTNYNDKLTGAIVIGIAVLLVGVARVICKMICDSIIENKLYIDSKSNVIIKLQNREVNLPSGRVIDIENGMINIYDSSEVPERPEQTYSLSDAEIIIDGQSITQSNYKQFI